MRVVSSIRCTGAGGNTYFLGLCLFARKSYRIYAEGVVMYLLFGNSLTRLFLIFLFAFPLFLYPLSVKASSPETIKNFLVLLDISGSMEGRGDGNGRAIFGQVKKVIKEYVQEQVPSDFNLKFLLFDEKVMDGRFFESTKKSEVDAYIDALVANGKNTNIYGTIKRAIDFSEQRADSQKEPLIILLFTDGHDNIGELNLDETARILKNFHKSNMHVFFYYFLLSSDNDPALVKLEESGLRSMKLDTAQAKWRESLSLILKQSKQDIDARVQSLLKEQEKNRELAERAALDRTITEQNLSNIKAEREALASANEEQEKLRKKTEAEKLEAQKILDQIKLKQKNQQELSEQDKKIAEQAEKDKIAAQNLLHEIENKQQQINSASLDLEKREKEANEKLALADKTLREAETLNAQAQSLFDQHEEIQDLLFKADALALSENREDLEQSLSLYSSVLKAQKNNARANAGIDEVNAKIYKKMGFFEKHYGKISLAIILLMACFLVVRTLLLKKPPRPIKLQIVELGSGEKKSLLLNRKRFSKLGDEKKIGRISGHLNFPSDSVVESHAGFVRKGNHIYFRSRAGLVFDETGQNCEMVKIVSLHQFCLATTADSFKKGEVFSFTVQEI